MEETTIRILAVYGLLGLFFIVGWMRYRRYKANGGGETADGCFPPAEGGDCEKGTSGEDVSGKSKAVTEVAARKPVVGSVKPSKPKKSVEKKDPEFYGDGEDW